ncbi:MAG TPA: hypothetical protein VM241_03225 [Candidatus Thermoplasmatota archaeon]|nr:hypothetical protein [Candidatus Thermoplasmatota archaeon]
MPETTQPGQSQAKQAKPVQVPQRTRPPGEMGGHTVMPWEQGEAEPGQAASTTPAGSDPTTTASGGSSKSVPPPTEGKGKDGLGQGSGATTVKAADGMMPPASQTVTGEAPKPMSGKPPVGSAGALAKAQPLEQSHPEGMEQPTTVQKGDAPSDALEGAGAVARKATPQASKATESGAQPVGKPAAPPQARPTPAAVDRTAKESAPMVPSSGQDAAKAASGAAVHPTNPAAQATSGQPDLQDEALIKALDQKLAEMLARALHETVAEAVRQSRVATRPAAPPPVQPAKK